MNRINTILLKSIGIAAIVLTIGWLLYHDVRVTARLGDAVNKSHFGFLGLSAHDANIRFERDAGAGRPFILASDQTKLVEYSDWDYSSAIYVEGSVAGANNELLYLHPHGYASDPAENRITHTMRGQDWELIKEVQITGERKVQIDFYFIARTSGIQRVVLSLGHYNWYYQNVRRDRASFTAEVNGLERYQVEEGFTQPAKYEVKVSAQSSLAPVREPIRIGFSNPWGVANVVTTYQLQNPAQDKRVLLASELVTWTTIEREGHKE